MTRICLIGDMIFDEYLYPYNVKQNQEVVNERSPKYLMDHKGIKTFPGGAGNVYDILSKIVPVDFITCNHFDYFKWEENLVINVLEPAYKRTIKQRLVVDGNVILRLDFDGNLCNKCFNPSIIHNNYKQVYRKDYRTFVITHYNKTFPKSIVFDLLGTIGWFKRPYNLILSLKPPVYEDLLEILYSYYQDKKYVSLYVVQNLQEYKKMSKELKDLIKKLGHLIVTSSDRVVDFCNGEKEVYEVDEQFYKTTNGAGDSFLSFFTYHVNEGDDVDKAIRYAIESTYVYLSEYNDKKLI